MKNPLSHEEALYFRDLLRAARYSALADAEGFSQICFALEELGMRLTAKKESLGPYKEAIRSLAYNSIIFSSIAENNPHIFSRFDSLYEILLIARNDAMHTGAYARHATHAAVELCINLEEALMNMKNNGRKTAADYMVKSVIAIEDWQLVAQARQMMLTYSFSFLPIFHDGKWKLLSDSAIACFLHKNTWKTALAQSISEATRNGGLKLIAADPLSLDTNIDHLLSESSEDPHPTLWLVTHENKLVGVLSPFELM